jgi:hypothetical protein
MMIILLLILNESASHLEISQDYSDILADTARYLRELDAKYSYSARPRLVLFLLVRF